MVGLLHKPTEIVRTHDFSLASPVSRGYLVASRQIRISAVHIRAQVRSLCIFNLVFRVRGMP